jgi:ribosomal protein L37E
MVDVSAIAGMMTALRGATDISKAMLGLRDAAMIQDKVIELNAKILDAQNAAFAANEERRELQQKIESLEAEVKRLTSLQGTGERCPRCGRNEFRVERSQATKGAFAVLGVRDYHMKCAACGFEDVKQTT